MYNGYIKIKELLKVTVKKFNEIYMSVANFI